VLEELSMPAVVVGTTRASGALPAVWYDNRAASETAITYLGALGHRRIGRVTGISRYWHTKIRNDAVHEAAGLAGIQVTSVEGDYTGESGVHGTRKLLNRADPPSAILYDNDVMAVAGLGEAQRMGVSVPADLSIMAWDDSMLCELVHPALTALRRDIVAVGTESARRLCEMAAGIGVGNFREPAPELMVRDSTSESCR
jgi:DNA-binding LacI/PurR family transcriptional regulator